LRHLRRDRALNSGQHRLYRHGKRQEAPPEPENEDQVPDGYEDARLRYAAWGCGAPPAPTDRRMD
jgi:hypothetical protein